MINNNHYYGNVIKENGLVRMKHVALTR